MLISRLFSTETRSFHFTPIQKIFGKNKGDTVEVYGWIRSKRVYKDFSFVVVNDGSNVNGIQVCFVSVDNE